MKLLKEIAKFIVWLSAALAGVGAILYALGYLVVLSHHHLLGLGPLLEYSHDYYIQRGWRFVLDLLIFPHGLVYTFVVILVVFTGIAIVFKPLWAKVMNNAQIVSHIWQPLHRLQRYLPWLGHKAIPYIVLFALSVGYSYDKLELCEAPLNISGLLFYDEQAVSDAEGLELALLQQNTVLLSARFEEVLAFEAVAIALFLAAVYVTRRWRWRSVALAPFAFVALIYSLLLPMVYGVLMLRSDYHRVEIVTAQDNTAHLPNADYYLLTSTTQAFVIWDATLRYILWIPHQEVQQLKLLAKQSLVFSGKLSQQQKAPQQ